MAATPIVCALWDDPRRALLQRCLPGTTKTNCVKCRAEVIISPDTKRRIEAHQCYPVCAQCELIIGRTHLAIVTEQGAAEIKHAISELNKELASRN